VAAALEVTPDHAAAVYDCLRAFEPFRSMRLPEADDVEFHIRHRRDIHAEYCYAGDKHSITVSSVLVGSFDELAKVVAHEMLHLGQAEAGTYTRTEHNPEFLRLARRICAQMVWDLRAFIG